jgi:hypothetical protein
MQIHAFKTRRGAERLLSRVAEKRPEHTFAVVNHPALIGADFRFCVALMMDGGKYVRAYVGKPKRVRHR